MREIILASSSPRRIEMLKMLGLEFAIVPSDFKEEFSGNQSKDLVVINALGKAKDVESKVSNGPIIIAADTLVTIDNVVMGKPSSKEDAAYMLRKLSGRKHEVYTGICVIDTAKNLVIKDCVGTSVVFKDLSDKEIDSYIDSGEPMDKAGAYGIQGRGSLFIEKIEGCYYNVMGLPLNKLYYVLGKLGVDILKEGSDL